MRITNPVASCRPGLIRLRVLALRPQGSIDAGFCASSLRSGWRPEPERPMRYRCSLPTTLFRDSIDAQLTNQPRDDHEHELS